MEKPSPTFSSEIVQVVSSFSATMPCPPNWAESAMVNQPACAAARSSSGFVPMPFSKRVLNEYCVCFRTPLSVEIEPLPVFKSPCQTTDALRCISVSPLLRTVARYPGYSIHRERRAVQRYIGSSIDGKSGGIAARNIADFEVHRIEIRFQRSDGVLRQESRFRLAEVERVFAVEFAGLDRVVKFLQGSQKLDGNKSRSGHAHLHLKNSPRRFVTHGFEWSADGASGVGKILLKAGAQLNDGHANVAEFHDVKAVEAIANVFAAQAENGLARLHQLREVGLQTGKVGTRLDRFRNGITRSFDLREGIVAVKIENVRRSADGLKG